MLSLRNSRVPAEWEVQSGIMMVLPHKDSDWEPVLARAQSCVATICATLTRFGQHVLLVVPPDETTTACRILERAGVDLGLIHMYEVATNDTWIRDFGPVTVWSGGGYRLLDFKFTAWGGKFAYDKDNLVTGILHAAGAFAPGIERVVVPLVLEGGAIESDGNGVILTTASCQNNPNRNWGLSRREIEFAMDRLGAYRVVWILNGYLRGDDTDFHIDVAARFAPGNKIVYIGCDDPNDEHFEPLARMREELSEISSYGADAGRYKLLQLPWPRAKYVGGKRLALSYANYLISNAGRGCKVVLVPQYEDPADAVALAVVKKAYPEFVVVGIDCRVLVEQGGSLHCMTMQLPMGVLNVGKKSR